MEMILTQDLCKTFKTRRSFIEAVKNVNLEVKERQIFGFLGPNGAGKTTTMRMLTTLMAPTSGMATIVGYNLFKDAKKIRQSIGYVSQKGGCYEFATGYENIVLQGRLYGLSKIVAQQNADKFIRLLKMEEYCNRKVVTYSGGQRRHVDLAMGLIHNPKLLFLDEPTTGLDPTSRAYFWEEIQRLRDNGITIFLTTHYLDEADALCDTICIMDHGSVVAQGTSSDLKRQIAGDVIEIGMDKVYFEKAKLILQSRKDVNEILMLDDIVKLYVDIGEKALPEILPLFIDAKIPIKTIQMTRPSLDEVFLKKTGHSLNSDKKEGE